MVKIIGGFEDIGELAHETSQAVVSQTKQQVTGAAKTAASQITGNPSATNPSSSAQQQMQNGANEQANAGQPQMSDDQAQQFLKDLYGPSSPADKANSTLNPQAVNSNQASTQNIIAQSIGLPRSDPGKDKTPEEMAKLQSLRNQLHADYYADLTRPSAPQEHVTEKLEREDQEKQMQELEADKEKPQALPATQKVGTGESVVGVSG